MRATTFAYHGRLVLESQLPNHSVIQTGSVGCLTDRSKRSHSTISSGNGLTRSRLSPKSFIGYDESQTNVARPAGGESMAFRIGPGPVFEYEWLVATRPLAAVCAAVGIRGVAAAGAGRDLVGVGGGAERLSRSTRWRRWGETDTLIGIGSPWSCWRRPRRRRGRSCWTSPGNLALLLVTGLSDAEIVLGKLLAGCLPARLVVCTLPVLGIGALLGGLNPEAMGFAPLVTFDAAVLACCLAMALSVWSRRRKKSDGGLPVDWCLALVAADSGSHRSVRDGGVPPAWIWCANPYWLAFKPSVSTAPVSVIDLSCLHGLDTGVLRPP